MRAKYIAACFSAFLFMLSAGCGKEKTDILPTKTYGPLESDTEVKKGNPKLTPKQAPDAKNGQEAKEG